MRLLFKPRDAKYTGDGDLPFGNFEDTHEWKPATYYLEQGAEMFPDKPMFKVGDRDGKIVESYTYKETNEWANKVANSLINDFGIKQGDKVGMYMLNRAEYVKSYKQAGKDENILTIAEEGMEEYLKQLPE